MSYIPDHLSSQYANGSLGTPAGYSHTLTPAIYPHPVPNYSALGMPSHAEYSYFYPLWITMRDTYTGESAVKAKRTVYLPRLDKQTDAEYSAYLKRTPFYNAIRRTHQGLMGSVYRKDPTIKIAAGVKLDLERVTRDGQSFTALLKMILMEQLLTGRFGMLVDLPESGGKPFVACYNAETILNWRERMIDGVTTLDQVLLLETDYELTSVGVSPVLQFRLLELVPDEVGNMVYQQTVTKILNSAEAVNGGGKISYTVVPRIRGRTLNYIPFVFAGAGSNTSECDYPPLLDVATMNLSHYQSYAALEHGRFYAAMPTYYICQEGFNTNDTQSVANPYIVGPNNLWLLGKEDKPGILEFQGRGLEYLENALEMKQSQMASLGGKLITQSRKQAAISSNAWELLSAGDEATLLDICQRADEAATKVLRMLVEFGGTSLNDAQKQETFVELNKQFEASELTAREIRAIESIYASRFIPKQVLYNALREVAVVPPTMTEEEFYALLDDEANLAEKPEINPTTGKPMPRPGA